MRHAPHPTNEYGGEYEHPKYEYAWKGGLKGKARRRARQDACKARRFQKEDMIMEIKLAMFD